MSELNSEMFVISSPPVVGTASFQQHTATVQTLYETLLTLCHFLTAARFTSD